MESEIQNLIKVWILACAALSYCYFAASRFPKGIARLLSVLPVVYLFTVLPLQLHSFHLGGPTAFFLVWLANFNLLLFAFGQGPLSPTPANLVHFISLACLPVKLPNPNQPTLKTSKSTVPRPVVLAIKALLLVLLFQSYGYKQYFNPYVVLGLYCVHVYLEVEMILVLCGFPARAVLGFELGPQFNEPYRATSLQDFWGRRWNLVVSGVLRVSVYDPLRRASTRALGEWSRDVAMLATFLVSALMHEVLYYYITRVPPTWEVTCFFVLHGFCTALEVAVKRKVRGRWRLHRTVAGALTVAFVAVTGVWLFLPQLTRNGVDDKAVGEYSMVVSMVGRAMHNLPLHFQRLF